MATLITKNSSTAAAVPGAGDIVQGELAVNVADKRLFTKDAGGAVVEVGTNPSSLIVDGNVGVGVTPSAWSVRALQLTGSPAISTVNGIDITYNAFYDGAWKYVGTARALHYSQAAGSGEHRWFTATSGTAGAAISFTQIMTLNEGGVLTLGSNIPALNVGSSAVSTGDCSIEIGPGRTGNGNAYIDLTGDTTYSDYGLRIIRNNGGPNTSSSINHRGTGDLQLSCSEAAAITFATNGSERARITSGGDLLVGTTSNPSSARVNIETTGVALIALGGATAAASFQNTSSDFETGQFWNKGTTGDNIFAVLYTETSATARGSIDYNRAGGLTRYNTTSDYRAKDIIGPVQNPGATIDALKVYEGVMKGATQSRPMLVAHEAQAHAPYAVSGVKDEVNEDGTPKFQQMDVSSLVPLLLAEIQSLRARVAALETP